MSATHHAWVQERIELAKRLNEGECGGYYSDAMLILSAVLSGLAADLWPSKGKDRRRFVEAWSTLSSLRLNPNAISVPLLLDALEKEGNTDLVEKVRATRPGALAPWDSLVVTGERVDQSEDELATLDPRLTSRVLRRFSYGNVFYEHVRSGYTHEYHTTESARSYPQTSEPAPVSYVNVLKRPVLRRSRPIHFDIAWVAEVVESVSASIVVTGRDRPLPDPRIWWVEGEGT
jgi:hypothetical protein